MFENTRVINVEDGQPLRVETEHASVSARDVVVATHLPVVSKGMFFARAHRSASRSWPHGSTLIALA